MATRFQVQAAQPVGTLLREWRERRRLSQLDLSLQAEISSRHISFVETGRSQPSRELILRLGEHLDLPFRERNRLLLAAGFAPVYAETALDAPPLRAVRDALRQMLTGHDPYPAVVVDRHWNMVEANASLTVLTAGIDPALLAPPVNVYRASLHPAGMARQIANLGEWRGHLLARLRRQVESSGDVTLARLLEEVRGYPCDQPVPEVEIPGPGQFVIPLRLRSPDGELAFFSTVATFGTPLDVTVSELVIEAFYPADDRTAAVLTSRAAAARSDAGT